MNIKNRTRKESSSGNEVPEHQLPKKKKSEKCGLHSSGKLNGTAPQQRKANGSKRKAIIEKDLVNISALKNLTNTNKAIVEIGISPICFQFEDIEQVEGGGSVFEGAERAAKLRTRAKKVRFSLRNNVVWKPGGPLPPLSVRLPPLAMPRGSALKKGVAAGPVCILSPSKRRRSSKRRRLILAPKDLKRAKHFSEGSKIRKTRSMK